MSVGHRLEDWELAETSLRDLYHALGENDTPMLYDQPFDLDTEHDWPAAGGMSLDRKTVYIDRIIFEQIISGEFKASGLTPGQIVYAWVTHERIENAIVAGDNPVDHYITAHKRALAAEHQLYRACGVDPAKVEEVIWPALRACYQRPIKKPPVDAWCGVYSDDAGPEEEAILAQLVALDVADARRRSKYETSYGMRGHRCDQCRNWDLKSYKGIEKGTLAHCLIVSGVARADRGCDFWMPLDDVNAGIEDGSDRLAQSVVDYTAKGHAPELCDKCVHWLKPDRCEVVRGTIAAAGWCRLFHK